MAKETKQVTYTYSVSAMPPGTNTRLDTSTSMPTVLGSYGAVAANWVPAAVKIINVEPTTNMPGVTISGVDITSDNRIILIVNLSGSSSVSGSFNILVDYQEGDYPGEHSIKMKVEFVEDDDSDGVTATNIRSRESLPTIMKKLYNLIYRLNRTKVGLSGNFNELVSSNMTRRLSAATMTPNTSYWYRVGQVASSQSQGLIFVGNNYNTYSNTFAIFAFNLASATVSPNSYCTIKCLYASPNCALASIRGCVCTNNSGTIYFDVKFKTTNKNTYSAGFLFINQFDLTNKDNFTAISYTANVSVPSGYTAIECAANSDIVIPDGFTSSDAVSAIRSNLKYTTHAVTQTTAVAMNMVNNIKSFTYTVPSSGKLVSISVGVSNDEVLIRGVSYVLSSGSTYTIYVYFDTNGPISANTSICTLHITYI